MPANLDSVTQFKSGGVYESTVYSAQKDEYLERYH